MVHVRYGLSFPTWIPQTRILQTCPTCPISLLHATQPISTNCTPLPHDPDLSTNKYPVLITGVAPKGLGGEAALTIAHAAPARLILTARDSSRAEPVQSAIATVSPTTKTTILPLDLSSLSSVRAAAATLIAEPGLKIDVLINNAAIMAAPYSTTAEGFEMQFGVAHLGHFLLTNLLLKAGKIADGGRIVSVSSDGHNLGPMRFEDPSFGGGKDYEPWQAYGQAKTANMLFALGLAPRVAPRHIKTYSLHPGVISTELGRNLSDEQRQGLVEMLKKHPGLEWKSLQQGIATHLVAAFDPDVGVSGAYLADCAVQEPGKAYAGDKEGAERLWKLSEEMVGEKFEF